ncbi:MAG: bifunctional UDP-N-acetylglucosamine diphosphorylase/glucosamine-1-phosphate N-acetyltransferase GlmU, partial [Clostridia bacterium]|nr:bifunctional UDP-N-acetylglucosamine diphosphorylase/glucosamine-1-phosphate N-acetyltransferase GlmU [Clostridia bacterium]
EKAGIIMINNTERQKIIAFLSESGVEIPCTDGVIIEASAEIEKGAIILPNTIITGNTRIKSGAVIGPNSYIKDSIIGNNSHLNNTHCTESTVGSDVTCGPFVHIRPNCNIKDNVHIGNFVEVKNSVIDENSKLPHLLYVGDSDVGKEVNFGCGCVTVNYDGKTKSRTVVKDGAFIGCNTNLIAPVTVGENAFTAAGSTITKDIPANALSIARCRQTTKDDWVNIKKPYKRQHTEK